MIFSRFGDAADVMSSAATSIVTMRLISTTPCPRRDAALSPPIRVSRETREAAE